MGWYFEIAVSVMFASVSFALLAIGALVWDCHAEPEKDRLTTDLEP